MEYCIEIRKKLIRFIYSNIDGFLKNMVICKKVRNRMDVSK